MIRTAIVLALTVLCLLNVSRAMAIERSELQLASVNAAVAYADDEGWFTARMRIGGCPSRPSPN